MKSQAPEEYSLFGHLEFNARILLDQQELVFTVGCKEPSIQTLVKSTEILLDLIKRDIISICEEKKTIGKDFRILIPSGDPEILCQLMKRIGDTSIDELATFATPQMFEWAQTRIRIIEAAPAVSSPVWWRRILGGP